MIALARLRFFLALLIVFIAIVAHAGPLAGAGQYQVYMPLVSAIAPPSPFGFDLRYFIADTAMPCGLCRRPKLPTCSPGAPASSTTRLPCVSAT